MVYVTRRKHVVAEMRTFVTVSNYGKAYIHENGILTNRKMINIKIDNKNSVIAKFVSTFKRFCNKEYVENNLTEWL